MAVIACGSWLAPASADASPPLAGASGADALPGWRWQAAVASSASTATEVEKLFNCLLHPSQSSRRRNVPASPPGEPYHPIAEQVKERFALPVG